MISSISRNLASLASTIVSAISSLCSRISAFTNRIFSRQDDGFGSLEGQMRSLNTAVDRRNWRAVDTGLGGLETDLPNIEGKARSRFNRSELQVLSACDKVGTAFSRIGEGIDRVSGANSHEIDALLSRIKAK